MKKKEENKKMMEFGQIENGQYQVKVNLNGLNGDLINRISQAIGNDNEFGGVCQLNGNVLEYKSETIFPEVVEKNKKKKVLIILGNPATHSIRNEMFFFSQAGNQHKIHQFWGRLREAGLLEQENQIRIVAKKQADRDNFGARKIEAKERKKLISMGITNTDFVLGLTTYFSFPTPVSGNYKDVEGVKKIFGGLICKIKEEEYSRQRPSYLSIYLMKTC